MGEGTAYARAQDRLHKWQKHLAPATGTQRQGHTPQNLRTGMFLQNSLSLQTRTQNTCISCPACPACLYSQRPQGISHTHSPVWMLRLQLDTMTTTWQHSPHLARGRANGQHLPRWRKRPAEAAAPGAGGDAGEGGDEWAFRKSLTSRPAVC